MEDFDLYYLSKANSNFPLLRSAEQDKKEIAQTLECLETRYQQLKQHGENAKLVCDLSHNNLAYEHLQYLAETLQASPVQLHALDLSCNRIFARTWHEVVPLIKQLLTKVTHVDLAGNYFPVVLPEQPQLQDMLKQNVSLTAPNRYLGSTDWVRQWTSKAHAFRRIAYRCVCVAQQQHTIVWDYLKLQWAAGRKTVMLSEGSEQHLSFSQTDSMLSWLMRGLAAMLLQPHRRLR